MFGSDPLSGFFMGLFGGEPLETLIFTLILSLLILIGLNISGKFKTAIDGLIDANPTTISNPVIFQVLGILLFLIITAMLVGSLISLGQRIEYTGFGFYVLTELLTILLYVAFGYAYASLFFDPKKANLSVDSSSTTAEDFIALLSFSLKAPLVLVKMISNLLVVLGALAILNGVFTYTFAEGYDVFTGLASMGMGVGWLVAGVFLPFLLYLVFLFLYPVYNFWLAILHIPKIGKVDKQ